MSAVFKLGVMSFVVVSAAGCDGSRRYPVSGVVLTQPGLERTHWVASKGIRVEGDVPVAGADVALFFDKDATCPVPEYAALTDDQGAYEIKTDRIPAAKDPDGYYYLAVKKDGYETFVGKLEFGVASHFRLNTVLLRKVTE